MRIRKFIAEWLGTIAVAFYAWVSLVSQIVLHWQISTNMQGAYIQFKDKLSPEKLAFISSSMDCRMSSQIQAALSYAVIGGGVAAMAVFLVSRYFMTDEGSPTTLEGFRMYSLKSRQFSAIAYLASIAYFAILFLIFWCVDSHGLFPYVDGVYGVIIAGIIGASLVITCNYRRTRYGLKDCFEITRWKMAHQSAMHFFSTTVSVFMMMLVAFGAVAVVQGFVNMPREIASSYQYGNAMTCYLLLTLIPVLGAGVGIVMPALDRIRRAEDRIAELSFNRMM